MFNKNTNSGHGYSIRIAFIIKEHLTRMAYLQINCYRLQSICKYKNIYTYNNIEEEYFHGIKKRISILDLR